MVDLISRVAAITGIGELIREYREKGEDATADGLILSRRYVVKTLPAVDAVPVVRCRDCEFYGKEPIGTLRECYRGCGWTEPIDYCSRGKRRDDDALSGR